MKIVPYQKKFEAGVQQLFATPIHGMISLSLMRHPDSQIGAQVQTEIPNMFLVIDSQEMVIGVFNVGTRRHFLKGKIVPLPYFCDLRIHKEYQSSSALFRIIKHLHSLNLGLNQLPATTAVFADNIPMLKIIAKAQRSNFSIIPYYQKIADIETFIFNKIPRFLTDKNKYEIRKAKNDDIPAMHKLQTENQRDFMMLYQFDQLNDSPYYYNLDISDFILLFNSGVLEGMIGTWNTSGFKQTKVHKYHWTIKMLRPVYNLIASKLLGFPALAKEGKLMKTTQLHSVIIKDRNKDAFLALLQYILQEKDGPLMLTLDERDPVYNCLGSAKTVIKKKGHIYQITYGKELEKPDWIPVDVARI